MQEIYNNVAKNFASKINAVFESEDTMKLEFAKRFAQLEFSRTDHWNSIIYSIIRDAWNESGPLVKSQPTGYDILQILKATYNLLDYNLFTQVYLNLQYYSTVSYRAEDAQKEIDKLKADWVDSGLRVKGSDGKILDPFGPKPKMLKTATNILEQQYNVIVSTLRSLKIIGSSNMATGAVSYRVSPKGSTPAFADSQNLSMLGIGADKYLRVSAGFKPFYLMWADGTAPATIKPHITPGTFQAEGVTDYLFTSKSGGEILNEVLFARKLMYEVIGACAFGEKTCTLVPRMNSILIITSEDGTELKQRYEGHGVRLGLKQMYPMVDLQEGSRV